ncbi:MAG: spore coat associated protein CotJA [Clostridia bacterium]|nr:spore coat associated protein CotJA [Clostridia bacterium]
MDVIRELQNSEFFVQPLPKNTVVAMAYVPYQNAKKLYSAEHGIQMGTMFPELNKPFNPDCKNGGMKNE